MKAPALGPGTDRIGLGIASVVSSVACFAIVDATAKWLGESYSPFQIVFFRYVFGMLPIVFLVWRAGGPGVLKTRRPLLHALRAGLLFFALTSFFAGLRYLPLAEAIAVTFTAPLFVAALSQPLLGEAVGPRRWSAVIVGFLGALVILRPGTDAFRPEALLLVGSALAFSLAMLLTRRMARSETNVAMLTYSTLGALLACLPFLVVAWRAPAGEDFGLFLLVGVVGGFGAYMAIAAHRFAPPVVVAPFQFTGLVWGAILGWMIWHEVPETAVWLGAGVIVLSSLYVTHREARAASGT